MDKLNVFGEGKSKNGSTKGTSSAAGKSTEKGAKKAGNSVQLPGGTDVYDDLAAIERAVSPEVVERYRKGDPTVKEAAKEAGIPATMQEAEELWETLDISNDYIFGFVMRNRELCEGLLRRILPNVRGLKVVEVRQQSVVENALGVHGIRLDIYARDSKGVLYDIEMQTSSIKHLPRRMRFYQGTLDSRNLEKGTDYSRLPKTYIIFVCCFDPFNKGRLLYRFENYCKEADQYLDDGSAKFVVNVTGKDDKLKGLQTFADYVLGKDCGGDNFVTRIAEEVVKVKNDAKFRGGYLMYNAALMGDISNALEERERLGMEKGIEKGRLSSIACLISRADERTAREYLNATNEEIEDAKRLLDSGKFVLP